MSGVPMKLRDGLKDMEKIKIKLGYGSSWLSEAFDLFNLSGLKRSNMQRLGEALSKRSEVCTAWADKKLIAIGTMLTDYVMYSAIFDVAVLPEFQGKGVGKSIMLKLEEVGEGTCIHLTSTFGNETFYGSMGYMKHKTALAKYPLKLSNSPYLKNF